MHILSKRSIQALIVGSTIIGSFALVGTAFAAGPGAFNPGGPNMPRPAVVGTVASVSGDTLTVNSKNWQRGTTATPTTSTIYTVDATNATVTKSGATSSVSAIAVGDTVMVQGTVSGTSVTATSIRDGMMGRMGQMPPAGMSWGRNASSTPLIQGNGEPVIGGSVTTISGTTLTVSTQNGTAYTVDASSATVEKGGAASTISAVAVGDRVIVQGAVTGTSVAASSVIDQATSSAPIGGGKRGVMSAIGGFFTRLFGFF
jgi:hypothetical protein